MRFDTPFIRLPITFDAETLEHEVRALPQSSWVPHPTGFVGNEAVRLITVNGQPTDGFEGPMQPTDDLARLPYVQQVMAELDGVWSRSRLMGLGAGAEVPEHVDAHYHWRTHIRIHVPVITDPKVLFTCGGETVHMAPGECWLFDSFQRHEVHNRGDAHRAHLVLDTVGGRGLWDLIEQAESETPPEPRLFNPGEGTGAPLLFEQLNVPKVMSPWELQCHIAFLKSKAKPHPKLDLLMSRLDRLRFERGAAWVAYCDTDEGLPVFEQLMRDAAQDVGRMDVNDLYLTNDLPFLHVLGRLVFEVAIDRSGHSERQQTQQKAGTFAPAHARLAS